MLVLAIGFPWNVLMISISLLKIILRKCRFLSESPPKLRIMAYGCDIRAEQDIITCTRNTVILLSMVLLSKCIMRWLLVIEWGPTAFRLLKLLQYLPNFARGRALSNSMIPKSSSLWSLRKLGLQAGSWKPHSRHLGRIYLCNPY